MLKTLKSIIGFSLRRKYFILFATFLLLIGGIVTFKHMPIEAFPDVTNTEISIITQWSGRSAEEVEKFITIPIEIALNPVQKKTSLRSTSIFGLSQVQLIFEDNVTYEQARMQVSNMLENVDLPDDLKPEIQPPTGPTGEIFRYTLRSDIRDVRELKTIQDWTVDRQISAVPGVADVVSFGGKTKAFEIQVNPGKIATLGITSLDVFEAVEKSNINIGGDVINQNDQAYVVRGIGVLDNIEEVKNVIVQNKDGVPVLIKDIAEVKLSNLPQLGHVGRTNTDLDDEGNRIVTHEDDVVQGIVLMRKGENPSEVIDRLKERIELLNNEVLPSDVAIAPFYNREDLIDYATHTVLGNLIEGMLLVTLIVSLFMFNWRTTLIVSLIIPLSLLFALICLRLMGMSANLLSLGAIDFGIIVDGSVVMVEGIFVAMGKRAKELGMARFNKVTKLGLIKRGGASLGKAVFFSKLIIIAALLPIFAFQKVEGKMFSPLAYTLGFALLGGLILTITLVPVLISMLLKKNIREKNNPIVNGVNSFMLKGFDYSWKHRKKTMVISICIMLAGLFSFKFLGSEFLPELDEGSIWLRVQLPYSISLDKSVEIGKQVREKISDFTQVKSIVSQTGRPDDGTDVTGFYNNEFDILLHPEKKWTPKMSKEQLIEEMTASLSVIPGVDLNFSQPISDNIEEAVSGVKGSIVVKIYGDDLVYMEEKANDVYRVLSEVEGITDLGVIRNIGQPELDIDLDQRKMALYGVRAADANAVIEMAIGGKAATKLYEGVRNFDVRLRIPEEFRKSAEDIGNLIVPTESGAKVPVREIATITTKTGPSLIFRDENRRYAAIKFSVRGRDMGSAIKEAQAEMDKNVVLKSGYKMEWQGDFENAQRATKRLQQVVPISLLLILLLLFTMFGNFKDSLLVFLNVPFAIVGGILALLITGTNFSISAGIGFIALFGICILFGVLIITEMKRNMEPRRLRRFDSLQHAIRAGVKTKIRPVMMTAFMDAVGLFPAAISMGIGSESSRPLARVIVGGVLFAMLFSIWIFPLFFNWAYRKSDKRIAE